MTEPDPLLRAVCEHPAEDAPRLVYADWLEETGRPERAEFIRVQVERARLPADDSRQEDLRERDFALRYRHDTGWRKELPRLSGVNWQRFWRGFVSGVNFERWRFFHRFADSVFSTIPVQFLRLAGVSADQCRELVSSPYLGQLLGLDLRMTRIGSDGIQALAECPSLVGLQSLVLRGVSGPERYGVWQTQALGEAGAYALAVSPYLRSLTRLDLTDTHVSGLSLSLLQARFADALIYRPPG
jgi:uncharacterized protein (TIGR02996 family)